MAFPLSGTVAPAGAATSSPALSGTFIPEIWSGLLIQKFYAATVLAAISNVKYEGEIRNYGDKVIIRSIPNITIRDYAAEGPLTIERPNTGVQNLLIDKGKYFATVLDDVLRAQADKDLMDMWSKDASQQLKIAIDTEVLAYVPTVVAAENKGDKAGKISGDINLGKATAPITVARAPGSGVVSVMDLLIDLGVCLDEYNIPEEGRWCIMPAWMVGMLLKSDLRDASITGDSMSVYRNGRVGENARFTIYQSNLLPTAMETGKKAVWVIAGHTNGLTFASQLTEMETLRVESTFGTIMRGLQVYGFKMIDPTCVAAAYCVRG